MTDEIDVTRWSGSYPLPAWWDGTGHAESSCAAPGRDDVTGLTLLCTRPDGHDGRHMAACGAPEPAIIRAWPGTTEPAPGDLDDQAAPACTCAELDDGWWYLWLGRWYIAVRVSRHSIALAAGQDVT